MNALRQSNKRRNLGVLAIAALLLALAAGVFFVSRLRTTVSGAGQTYVLEANQTRVGILVIKDGATAVFRQGSHWIGPVGLSESTLTVEDEVTVTGLISLAATDLRLGENAVVRGGVVSGAGNVYLGRGASVRGGVVSGAGSLFLEEGANVRGGVVLAAGGLSLASEASMRGDVYVAAGNVKLGERAALHGDAVLAAGAMQMEREALADGRLAVFAGGLTMAPQAVLQRGAVLYAGDVRLSPEARIRGDVIVTEGNVTLEGQSEISGRLYLDPESEEGWGRLSQSPEAQITGGVNQTGARTAANWRVGLWALGIALQLAIVPVAAIALLMGLVFYLGRRSGAKKHQAAAAAGHAGSGLQPTVSGTG